MAPHALSRHPAARALARSRASAPIVVALASAAALLAGLVAGAVPAANATAVLIQDGFNGDVYDTVTHDGTRYVAGTFTAWGPQTGGGALVDADSGVLNRTFADFDNDVLASVDDGEGGLFVAGYFRRAGSLSTSIAHIRADGTVDTSFTAFVDDGVYALALSDGTLYAGGDFTCVNHDQEPQASCAGTGDVLRNQAAAFSVSDGSLLAWDPNINSTVSALAVSGTSVFVGGSFDSVGGTNIDRLAEVSASTGLPSSWAPNPDGTVLALAVSGSTLYVGGRFTTIGSARSRLASFDLATSGIPLTSWNPSLSGSSRLSVSTIVVDSGTVYVGGEFWTIGGQSRNHLAALDPDTGLATAWNPNASSGPVTDIGVIGSALYVAGEFQFIGPSATPRRGAAAVTLDLSAQVLDWNPNPNADGSPITVSALGGEVFLGGAFTTINDWQARTKLASLNPVGTLTTWAPSVNSYARELMVIDDRLYVLGGFTTIQSIGRPGMAAFDLATGGLTSWNPNADSSGFDSWDTAGGLIYVAGDFTTMGGLARPGLAAVDASTGAVTPWNPGAPEYAGAVWDLVVSGDRVYISGGFTMIGSDARHLIAALDITTAATLPWDPQLDGSNVRQIGIVGSVVVFGGNVTCMATTTYGGGCSSAGEVPLEGMGGADAETGAPVPGWIHQLTISDGDLGYPRSFITVAGTTYAAGQFTVLDGQAVGNFAAFTSSGDVITAWRPDADAEVYSLKVDGGSLTTAGRFDRINGSTPRFLQSLAPFSSPAPSPEPGGGGSSSSATPTATSSPTVSADPESTGNPTPVVETPQPAPSRRRLGSGVVLVTGGAAARATPTLTCSAPGRTLSTASTMYRRAGGIIKLRTRGVPRKALLDVRMLIGTSWVPMGRVTATARGTVDLPAFTAARSGSYPLRLATSSGSGYYTTVETGKKRRPACS